MTKNKRNSIKHVLSAVLFWMVMSIGMICLADEKGTVKVASAKIRASADASSEQLGSVAQGGTVDIVSETTGTDGQKWYQVYVDANTKGYIRADLIDKNGGSDTTTTTQTTDQTPTNATAVEAKKGTVITNNVRIRKGASTNHDVVATANRGMVVTVTGEANGADQKKWYQISFTYNNKEITGFIRSDLVTFDNVPADTAVSEITGEENSEEQTTEPETETQPAEETQPQPESQPTNESQNIILMNVEDIPYIMPGFVAVDLNWNDQKINAYKNGNFYIFYAQKQNGEEGWYLFDSEKSVYQRYVYTSDGVVSDDGNAGTVGMIPVIILVVIIIILIAAVGLLALKLRDNSGYDDGYDDDGYDDDEYDDMEDIEELEEIDDDEEDEIPQPVRRPQAQNRRPQPQQGQPVRRPNPQENPQAQNRRPQPQQGQPVRHPNPQESPQAQNRHPQPQQEPVRRPNPQENPQAQNRRPQPQQGQPVRRPQPQENPQAQNRRPQPQQGQPVRRPQPQENPQAQNRRPQPQKGYKAKNLLENDDDSMDFIDI